MLDHPLTLYAEANTLDDAREYIKFKNNTEGWKVLLPPYPITTNVKQPTYGLILHKFPQD